MYIYVYITHNVCIIIILRGCRGRPVGLAVSIYNYAKCTIKGSIIIVDLNT